MVKKYSYLPRGLFYVIGVIIWEFFSYYGVRSLLILYLIHYLKLADYDAYQIFGAYTTLVYITPILGGWLADKYLGYCNTIIIGSIAIISGHLFLCFGENLYFYYGLSCLVIGTGLFKSNSICLFGEFFQGNKSSAYSIYYVIGNVGGTLAIIICAIIASAYGWKYGFLCAGIGMLIGLVIFLSGWSKVKAVENISKSSAVTKPKKIILLINFFVILIAVLIVAELIKYNIIDIPLVIIGLIALWIIFFAFIESTARKNIIILLFLMLFSTLFWSADQQIASSISVFIDGFVNRDIQLNLFKFKLEFTIPTTLFQSVNPIVIILLGPLVGLIWKKLSKHNIEPSEMFKIFIGMTILTLGFYCISYFSVASKIEQASLLWMFFGLVAIGLAEMFFDPVILSFISNKIPSNYKSRLSGLYYLLNGTYANYIAIKLAETTTEGKGELMKNSISNFSETYLSIFYFSIILMFSVLIFWFFLNINQLSVIFTKKNCP